MKGILSPNQSQFLAKVFSSPLFVVEGNEELKPAVLDAYLASESPDDKPDDIAEDIKLLVEYGMRTGQTIQSMKEEDDFSLLEIIAQTPSPFPEEVDENPMES